MIKRCDSILYAKDIVENKKKKLAANQHYWLTYAEINDELVPVLLTAHQVESGLDRAKKNPEDVVPLQLSWWRKLKMKFSF